MNTEILKLYPFNKIERWVVNSDTKILVKKLHPENSNYDEDYNPIDLKNGKYDIVTLFYPFFSKEEKVGDKVMDLILHNIPKSSEHKGYTIEECFMNEDGTFAPFIAVGSFLASEIDGVLRSVPGVEPVSGKKALDLLSGDNIIDVKVLKMIKKLTKFVLQSTNSQLVVGKGFTSSTSKEDTGSTMELGNSIGEKNGHVSIFGLEDFYGNLRTLCKGLELKKEGLFENGVLKDSNPVLSNGYVSKTKTGESLIPKELTGGHSTFYTDWYDTGAEFTNVNSKLRNLLTVLSGTSYLLNNKLEGVEEVLNWEKGGIFADYEYNPVSKEPDDFKILGKVNENSIRVGEIHSEDLSFTLTGKLGIEGFGTLGELIEEGIK